MHSQGQRRRHPRGDGERRLATHVGSSTAALDQRGAAEPSRSDPAASDQPGRQRTDSAAHPPARLAVERFFDLGLVAMAIETPTGDWVAINDRLCEMLGYDRDELLRMHWSTLTHPADLKTDWQQFEALLAGRIERYSNEKRFIRKDGEILHCAISATCSRCCDGKPQLVYALAVDITERMRAVEALRESETRYRRLFETMEQGVVYQDRGGLITGANPAAERILGVTAEQMRGRDSHDDRWQAIRDDGSPFPGSEHPAMVALDEGRKVLGVTMGVFNPKDDRYRWIRINAIPEFQDGESRPCGVYTSFEDITARRRAQDQVTALQEQLARSSRVGMLGEMATSLAHELNQPLNVIASYAQAARRRLETGLDETFDLPEALKQINLEAQHAATVIRGIRAFLSRGEGSRSATALNDVIAEIARLARIEARHLGARLQLDLGDEPLIARIDRVEIQQVILNLLRNAWEAMAGSPEIQRQVTIRSFRATDGQVAFSVRDHGPGIAPECVERLYEPFFSTKPGGMGMGLSLCRSIMERHHGSIEYHAVSTGGSEFVCHLPAVDVAPGAS
jgi:two-component system sensor kinase FixL